MDLSFDYTHQNHFKFGYYNSFISDVAWYVSPTGMESHKWVVAFDTCAQEPLPFRKEVFRAARLIHESNDEISNIMFSGGSESEMIVRAFHEQGIPFRVSILRFKKNLNIHDISFAVVFCEQHGIPYDIIELDIVHFMESSVYDYCNATQCPTPQLAPTMWLADQIDGLPILGSGEPYLTKTIPDDYVPGESPYEPSEWYFQEKERIQAWYRHFIQQGRPAVPGFFQYTPELMYAFLDSQLVRELVANKRIGKLSTVTSKSQMYRSEFRDMIPRPKFGGYEKIADLEEVVRDVLEHDYGRYNRTAEFEYHSFMKQLRKRLDREVI